MATIRAETGSGREYPVGDRASLLLPGLWGRMVSWAVPGGMAGVEDRQDMPVIGLSLAILPVLAVLAIRAVLKLIILPFQMLRLVSRGRFGLGLVLILGLCAAGAMLGGGPNGVVSQALALASR